ncbi:hypothetical protein E1286_17885 [Nonomuraea terrae]|uniref:Uncharacterized protein n=1 Tax=Nonomuraea terrae TaxID=2530383 RepID=A0A4R4YRY7_9ACTN|nr:hypothetical protein [Nonomuraea terrae]TDD47400.1 hypothetical protein E1286_17885 [Nonomuraea terrae]
MLPGLITSAPADMPGRWVDIDIDIDIVRRNCVLFQEYLDAMADAGAAGVVAFVQTEFASPRHAQAAGSPRVWSSPVCPLRAGGGEGTCPGRGGKGGEGT